MTRGAPTADMPGCGVVAIPRVPLSGVLRTTELTPGEFMRPVANRAPPADLASPISRPVDLEQKEHHASTP